MKVHEKEYARFWKTIRKNSYNLVRCANSEYSNLRKDVREHIEYLYDTAVDIMLIALLTKRDKK